MQEELEVTFERAVSVMWLMFWRGMVGALIFGFFVGVISLFMSLYFPFASRPGLIFNSVVGLAFGLFWYVCVVKMALKKKYTDFRIALIPHS